MIARAVTTGCRAAHFIIRARASSDRSMETLREGASPDEPD